MEVQTPLRKSSKIARLRNRFTKWFRKKSFLGKCVTVFLLVWLALFVFAERNLYGVLLLKLRIYAPVLIVCGLIVWAIYKWFWKRLPPKKKLIWGIAIIVLLVIDIAWIKLTPWGVYDYASNYYRYKTIEKISITSLPETDHEVIQPLVSVRTVAHQQLQGPYSVSNPYLVRDSNEYKMVMALQPNTFWGKIGKKINRIYSISAESSEMNFSGENQSEVSFTVADKLLLARNAHTATMRRLSLFQLFSIEIGEPRFMKDDNGEWVQVVPLIKWKGILFPQPEFGGVNIIRQSQKTGIGSMLNRFLFGAGTLYSPKEMKQFRFLQRQNLMPKKVTLSIAESFRFQKGFWAPMPSNHDGDTRIPVVEEDEIDEQPMTVFFNMSQVAQAEDMLYEYVGLQPYDEKKDGLVASLFIPSDGQMKVYVYVHDPKKDGVIGATAIPSRVREQKQSTDWTESKVTGIRPYIKKVNGRIRSFWRASIVTRSKHSDGWYSGVNSEIALIDQQSQHIIWVNPQRPQQWIAQSDSIVVTKVP